MENNNLLVWLLLISTFLIVGKAIGFLKISWVIAFGPLLLLFVSFVLVLAIGLVLVSKQIKNKEDEEN